MNINFKTIIVHNFLSYGHVEYDFRNRNFCKVVGINNCKEDNAGSNGAGKSTLFNALCWALTDKTTQGIDKNLKNLNIEENSCYVTVDFDVDGNSYLLTRTYKPSHYLKIIVNGKDESGKGIKESEAVLAKYLPDLSSMVVSSMIILGQGLPNKFTANKPSERKEILEQLSKSDFMISDIKDRITIRKNELAEKQREYEDLVLQLESKKAVISEQLEKAKIRRSGIKIDRDFDSELLIVEKELAEVTSKLLELTTAQLALNEKIRINTVDLQHLNGAKEEQLTDERNAFDHFYEKYLEIKSEKSATIKNLTKEIDNINNIKEVCPVCGQKIPHVHKPSTEKQEAEIVTLNEDLSKIELKYKEYSNTHKNAISAINKKYAEKITNSQARNAKYLAESNSLTNSIKELNAKKTKLIQEKSKIEQDKSNLLNILKELDDSITSYTDTLKKLAEDILYNNDEKQKILDALQLNNRLLNVANKDFRGFLLKNTIEFIDAIAKEYCKDIFKTDAIKFELDGNNINITYCEKPIENLSGGERQKIDLIIQFALRDMMSKFLNFNCNIIVLDEILDNLDAVGSNEIINFISRRLNDAESIFIISHNINELEIPCDSQLIVIKDENGISQIK